MVRCRTLLSRAFVTVGLVGILVALGASVAAAEEKHEKSGGGRGGRWDPAKMRRMQQGRIKEAMGATDEEWQALQPLIDKAQTISFQSRQGRVSLWRRGRRGGSTEGADAEREKTDLEKCVEELQAVLKNKDATEQQIAEKLKALREARAKQKEELTKAQEELSGAATPRQQAQLVLLGLLE